MNKRTLHLMFKNNNKILNLVFFTKKPKIYDVIKEIINTEK